MLIDLRSPFGEKEVATVLGVLSAFVLAFEITACGPALGISISSSDCLISQSAKVETVACIASLYLGWSTTIRLRELAVGRNTELILAAMPCCVLSALPVPSGILKDQPGILQDMRWGRVQQLLAFENDDDEILQSFWIRRGNGWILVVPQWHGREFATVRFGYATWKTVDEFFKGLLRPGHINLIEGFLFNVELLERLLFGFARLKFFQRRAKWQTLWGLEMIRIAYFTTERKARTAVPLGSTPVCTFVSEASGLQKVGNHPVLRLGFLYTPM